MVENGEGGSWVCRIRFLVLLIYARDTGSWAWYPILRSLHHLQGIYDLWCPSVMTTIPVVRDVSPSEMNHHRQYNSTMLSSIITSKHSWAHKNKKTTCKTLFVVVRHFAHLFVLVWWRRLLAGHFAHSASRHPPAMHPTKELSTWSNFMNQQKGESTPKCFPQHISSLHGLSIETLSKLQIWHAPNCLPKYF
jgi:hypothetical protein